MSACSHRLNLFPIQVKLGLVSLDKAGGAVDGSTKPKVFANIRSTNFF